MSHQRTVVALVMVAGMAVSGCSSRPVPPKSSGTGSPIAEPGRRLVLEPGSPAVASDGTIHRDNRRAMTEAPVPVVRRDEPAVQIEPARRAETGVTAARTGGPAAGQAERSGREAVIDLEGDGGADRKSVV